MDFEAITLGTYRAVYADMHPDDMTADGLPKMKPLNAALAEIGVLPINSAERDALHTEMETPNDDLEPAPPLEDAPTDLVTITVTEAMANPVPLYVHGVGQFSLRHGEPVILPAQALAALDNAGVIYTKESTDAED